jgi:hypothetical protein
MPTLFKKKLVPLLNHRLKLKVFTLEPTFLACLTGLGHVFALGLQELAMTGCEGSSRKWWQFHSHSTLCTSTYVLPGSHRHLTLKAQPHLLILPMRTLFPEDSDPQSYS